MKKSSPSASSNETRNTENVDDMMATTAGTTSAYEGADYATGSQTPESVTGGADSETAGTDMDMDTDTTNDRNDDNDRG